MNKRNNYELYEKVGIVRTQLLIQEKINNLFQISTII